MSYNNQMLKMKEVVKSLNKKIIWFLQRSRVWNKQLRIYGQTVLLDAFLMVVYLPYLVVPIDKGLVFFYIPLFGW